MSEQVPDAAGNAVHIVREAAHRAGFDPSGATIVRVRSSVHVQLPLSNVIARVERPGEGQLATNLVQVARALADRDAPVARLAHPEIQPLMIDGWSVTFWQRIHPLMTPSFEEVGGAVRRLHDLTVGSLPDTVRAIDPLTRSLEDLDMTTSWTGTVAAKELRRRAEDLGLRWDEESRADPLGRVVVHGDVHLDNAMVAEQGVVLIDLEDAGIGPASWDFAPLAVAVKRYGAKSGDYAQFLTGYGAEPGSESGFDMMCEIYELVVTTWAIRCSIESTEMADEAEIRVAGILDEDPTPWSLL